MINFLENSNNLLASIDNNAENALNQTKANIPTYQSVGIPFKFGNGSVGGVITALLPYVYTIAGIALLLTLIMGGITLMTSAGNPDKTKSGYGMITGAMIGFIIIFISFFLVQLIEIMLGVNILG